MAAFWLALSRLRWASGRSLATRWDSSPAWPRGSPISARAAWAAASASAAPASRAMRSSASARALSSSAAARSASSAWRRQIGSPATTVAAA